MVLRPTYKTWKLNKTIRWPLRFSQRLFFMKTGAQEVLFVIVERVILFKKAVRNLEIVYQPIWDIEKETVIGYEALCRPYARDPTSFIELARNRNRTAVVDMAIIRRAIVDGQCLIRSGQRLFLNVEPETMKDTMLWLPWKYDILPDSVVLEITERADAERTLSQAYSVILAYTLRLMMRELRGEV